MGESCLDQSLPVSLTLPAPLSPVADFTHATVPVTAYLPHWPPLICNNEHELLFSRGYIHLLFPLADGCRFAPHNLGLSSNTISSERFPQPPHKSKQPLLTWDTCPFTYLQANSSLPHLQQAFLQLLHSTKIFVFLYSRSTYSGYLFQNMVGYCLHCSHSVLECMPHFPKQSISYLKMAGFEFLLIA